MKKGSSTSEILQCDFSDAQRLLSQTDYTCPWFHHSFSFTYTQFTQVLYYGVMTLNGKTLTVCFCVCVIRKQTTERRGRKPTVSISMPCDVKRKASWENIIFHTHTPPPLHSLLHTHIFTQTHFKGQ